MNEQYSDTILKSERRLLIRVIHPPRAMDMVAATFLLLWCVKVATMPGNLADVHTLEKVFSWLPELLRRNAVWSGLAFCLAGAQFACGYFDLAGYNQKYMIVRRIFAAAAFAFWFGFAISITETNINATGSVTYSFGCIVNLVVAWRKY